MNKMVDTYLITRPRLAVLLMKKGYKCRAIVNPYNLNYKAWEFDDSSELRAIISDYYKSIKRKGVANDKA